MEIEKQKWKECILPILPGEIKRILLQLPDSLADTLEEIRIRAEKPLMVICDGKDYFLDFRGNISFSPSLGYKVTLKECQLLLANMSDFSLYAIEDELKNGYLTLKGGHRVGIVGKGVIENGKIKLLKYCSGFNIRITRQLLGVADKVLPYIIKNKQEIYHTLIVSPPQMGKTTLLRDIIRLLSDGCKYFNGVKVGVVDERSEIAGCYQGIAQNMVGIRTDILDACPKAEGIIMLIRSMSPRIIVTDEIGRMEDIYAIEEALNAGVKMITTAHGSGLEDLARRPVLKEIMKSGIFERYIVLGNSLGVGTVEAILDGTTRLNLIETPIR